MHHEIARRAPILGPPGRGRTRGITGLVYRTIRGVTRILRSVPFGLLGDPPEPEPLSPRAERLLAAVNGVVGDHLASTASPLAIPMDLRWRGQPIGAEPARLQAVVPEPRRRVVIFVHGLCMSDVVGPSGHADRLASLERTLGCTVLSVRYNTGLHISSNGRAFSRLLDRLASSWPVPIDRLSLIGHSMGGLVARSASEVARRDGHAWLGRLRDLVCLGSPHLGAPLSRGGHYLHAALGVSPYTAAIGRLGRICSAGLTDLRHGSLLDEDWSEGDRFAVGAPLPAPVPLPAGVRCLAVAGDLGWPIGLVGDGLVPLDSALGRHADPRRALHFPEGGQWILKGLGHLELLSDTGLHARLRRWLGADREPRGRRRRLRSRDCSTRWSCANAARHGRR